MNSSRDPERMIHAFLLEGADRLQDQVFDAVRADIDTKRQRVAVGPWRLPTMMRLASLGLGAAAMAAVILLGPRLLTAPPGPGASGASPSPTAIANGAAPTTTTGLLPVGPFSVNHDPVPPWDSPIITVTIPAAGWVSDPRAERLSKGPAGDPPQSAILLWAFPAGTAFDVYGDPCHWKSTPAGTPATTVDALVGALAAQVSREASDPVEVTFAGPDGYRGKKLSLRVPSAAVFAQCDDNTFTTFNVVGDPTRSRTQEGPGQIDELWVVNVNGAIVVMDVMYRPDTPAALIDEMRTIAASAQFGW